MKDLAVAKAEAEAKAALAQKRAADLAAAGYDSDEDAPRMNMSWSGGDEEKRPPTVSMARRMMSALGLSGKAAELGDGDRPRGPSLARALGLVDADGNRRDPRTGSIGRMVFSESSDGNIVAFRGLKKLASKVTHRKMHRKGPSPTGREWASRGGLWGGGGCGWYPHRGGPNTR